jgi:hypothetical protein
MKTPSVSVVMALLFLLACADDPILQSEVSAYFATTKWTAKGYTTSTGTISGILKTITAYADDGSQITISLDQMQLSPTKLSATFRTKTADVDYFHGSKINAQTVLIEWSTETESNLNYFDVLVSYDGLNYASIGNVYAVGYSNEHKYYSFTSNDYLYAITPNAYFKLRMVDYSGESVTTEPIEIKLMYEITYQDAQGGIYGGYNGSVELSEFDTKAKRLSGKFGFRYKNENGKEIVVSEGVLKNITY